MSTRERPADRGRRRGRDDVRSVAADERRARIAAGLSLRVVGAATGIDHARIWRFERGHLGELTVPDISAIGAVVGLDVRLRAYPAGDPIRDAGQQRLLERFRARLHPGLGWRNEVPLPIDGDLRAWDAMIRGIGWRIAVEAETVLDDIQAVERRIALKQRDGGIDHVILLVADTPRNRRGLTAAPTAFATFSRDARAVLRALAAGADPGASTILAV
jgi:transcriptional regulator with XRE-family HTH domain